MKEFIPVPDGLAAYRPGAAVERLHEQPPMPTDVIAYGNNAPELAMRPMDWKPELHPKQALAQLKVDGISAIYIQGKFYSMQGTPLHCCQHAIDEIKAMEHAVGFGLVICTEYEAGSFRKTIGAMRSGKPGLGTCWVYDAVPYVQWKENRFYQPLDGRLNLLAQIFERSDFYALGLLRHWEIETQEVETTLARLEAMGLEGIVVKDARSMFKRDRSSSWLRAKVEHTLDGTVSAVTATGFIVNIAGHGQHRISAGIPAEIKKQLSEAPADWIGKTIEVCANMEAGTLSLRHCRFVRAREDKDY